MIRKNVDIVALAVLLAGMAAVSHLWDNVMIPKLIQDRVELSSGIFHLASVPVCPYVRVVFR